MTLWGRREAVLRRTGRILPRIQVSFSFLAVVTLLLLADHRGIAAGALAASLLHECGHLGMLAAFGKLPRRVCLYGCGIRFVLEEEGSLSYGREAAVLMAGPGINLLFAALFWPKAPLFALVHVTVACFNLLPVEALDGGRLLSLLARRYNRPALERGFEALSFICCLALLGIGLAVFWISRGNFTFFLTGAVLAAGSLAEKGDG